MFSVIYNVCVIYSHFAFKMRDTQGGPEVAPINSDSDASLKNKHIHR